MAWGGGMSRPSRSERRKAEVLQAEFQAALERKTYRAKKPLETKYYKQVIYGPALNPKPHLR